MLHADRGRLAGPAAGAARQEMPMPENATPVAGRRAAPRRRRLFGAAGLLLALGLMLALGGCRTLGYYAHLACGHAELVTQRQPIERLIADPDTEPALRETLAEVLQARRFAVERLQLPDNRSYTYYVQLDRPFVNWNVMAAPEFSIEPLLHCFPFAGCVPYRGWFSLERAQDDAQRLQDKGYETHVGGVPAYSTLGWFADPLVSSMLRAGREALIGTVFHELTHQKLYLPGDAAFNESLATFVEQQGLREWRARQQSLPTPRPDYRPVIERILALRERLGALYAQPLNEPAMRAAKAAEIEAFRVDYRRWRSGEGQDRPAYDGWVEAPIDNAKLLPFGVYDQWVPAFEALFAAVDGDWERFHAQAAELARLPAEQRRARLSAL
jgi:predicted aminopeptidase